MEEESKKSLFNAGVAQAERIDSLQRAINAGRFNLIDRNIDTGTRNYEVIIAALDSLINECWGKATSKEKIKLGQIYQIVKFRIKTSPPVILASDEEVGYVERIDHNNLDTVIRLIDIYERYIREVLDAHNLNAPNRDMDDEDEL
jgi:hypothetical protein